MSHPGLTPQDHHQLYTYASHSLYPVLTTVGPVILSVLFCIAISVHSARREARDAARRLSSSGAPTTEIKINQRRLEIRRMVRAQYGVGGVARVESRSSDAPPTYGNSWNDTTLEYGDGVMPPAPTYWPGSRPMSVASGKSVATSGSGGSRDTVDSLESAPSLYVDAESERRDVEQIQRK